MVVPVLIVALSLGGGMTVQVPELVSEYYNRG